MDTQKSFKYAVHKMDLYTKPVTLTYDGERGISTVPGAICSLISLLLISF